MWLYVENILIRADNSRVERLTMKLELVLMYLNGYVIYKGIYMYPFYHKSLFL